MDANDRIAERAHAFEKGDAHLFVIKPPGGALREVHALHMTDCVDLPTRGVMAVALLHHRVELALHVGVHDTVVEHAPLGAQTVEEIAGARHLGVPQHSRVFEPGCRGEHRNGGLALEVNAAQILGQRVRLPAVESLPPIGHQGAIGCEQALSPGARAAVCDVMGLDVDHEFVAAERLRGGLGVEGGLARHSVIVVPELLVQR